MQDSRIDAAFEVLRGNVPRAPTELVERMVKTVNAMERERARRAGTPGRDMLRQATAQKQNDMVPKKPQAPEIKRPKPPGM